MRFLNDFSNFPELMLIPFSASVKAQFHHNETDISQLNKKIVQLLSQLIKNQTLNIELIQLLMQLTEDLCLSFLNT